ncbi:ExbD/TolR family protein [Phaeobacter inhibens]|uniref:ExbD/TolR family protein n=1 Tax=Phaeobacter inhibens TaxID=221822 RepID=UPI000C9C62AE|nr:biopolymer transporter ExbD [Phaeobacter inhibens]AUQ63424.1 putative biopolymer transport protein [Phaeobacter inhibens]AUQ83330.1 putative biopolymer transport protein [Phaeobacter inhibens]AUQ91089.1 putative biopolymer transport protein [Phaeobacter inhibens]AUR12473.1 putative biopolymer transport protein [Phaeobacter inhibens]MDO6756543.1 biopolymer transporter ExbD [Phaeobacter inhibens]
MDLTDPPRRARGESIVPMINVVFLLLIFFLMTSRLAQPDPFEVTPPEAGLEGEAKSDDVLYIDATGRLHFDGSEGRAALSRLASAPGKTVQLRADARLQATDLARILRQLAEAGLTHAELVVRPQ